MSRCVKAFLETGYPDLRVCGSGPVWSLSDVEDGQSLMQDLFSSHQTPADPQETNSLMVTKPPTSLVSDSPATNQTTENRRPDREEGVEVETAEDDSSCSDDLQAEEQEELEAEEEEGQEDADDGEGDARDPEPSPEPSPLAADPAIAAAFKNISRSCQEGYPFPILPTQCVAVVYSGAFLFFFPCNHFINKHKIFFSTQG